VEGRERPRDGRAHRRLCVRRDPGGLHRARARRRQHDERGRAGHRQHRRHRRPGLPRPVPAVRPGHHDHGRLRARGGVLGARRRVRLTPGALAGRPPGL
ncbi:MAG: hypothetical protein AVDCRST_MAG54-778, partial [uncultured Actinomycetospora sp.]